MKKGFTLVELLAVIVILAIIALIATPIVINIINDAKEASALRSAEGYMRAVENKVALSNLKESKITDGIYNVKDENIKAEYNGNGPTIGSITITNGIVASAKLCIDNVSIDYEENENKLSLNNYCLKNELVVDDEEIKNEQNLSSLTIDKKEGTHIICNNGVTITEENNKIKIDNIVGKVECKISNSIVDSVTDMDNTKNYILMLSDDSIIETLTLTESKNLLFNLNSKTITYNGSDSAIKTFGILNVIGENATFAGGNSIEMLGNSKTNINGGTYKKISITGNSTSTIYNTINECTKDENNCYPIYVTGNSNVSFRNIKASTLGKGLGLTDSSNVTIYDSEFICSNDNCIWDNSTGVLNIYNSKINTMSSDNEKALYGIRLIVEDKGIVNIYDSQLETSGFAFRNDANGTINIYSGTFTSNNSQTVLNIKTGTVNIYSGTFTSNNSQAVRNDSSGTINIHNGIFSSGANIAVYNHDSGFININGGKYISNNTTIANSSSGNINISDETAKVYIASYASGNIEYNKWSHSAVSNHSSGNIYINGNVADRCDETENTIGICIYNEFGRSILSQPNASGNIKINGSYVVSKDFHAVSNYKGTVSLCGTYISGGESDLYQNIGTDNNGIANNGLILYNSNVILKNNTKNETDQIVEDNNLVCTN